MGSMSFGRSVLHHSESVFRKWGATSSGKVRLPKLVVGLGNPGMESTRHNLGSDWVTYFAQHLGKGFERHKSLEADIVRVQDRRGTILMRPTNFMNLSGRSVKRCVDHFSLTPRDVLVVYDDMQVPVGRYGIRSTGTTRGHHGVNNVKRELNSNSFNRLAIGIGRPENVNEVIDYVLEVVPNDEMERIRSNVFEFLLAEFIKELLDVPRGEKYGVPIAGHAEMLISSGAVKLPPRVPLITR